MERHGCYMQASVKIMDIDVDMLTKDTFINKINEYLADDHLYVIFFASAESLDRAAKDSEYHNVIDKADLFLPGEEALLTTHHVDILEAGGMVVSCKSFGDVLGNLEEQGRTIYIMAQNEQEILILKNYCKRMQPGLKVTGSCVYINGIEDEAVVNDINNCLPDMLLVNLHSCFQERWIIEHAPQLNSKICIAIGGVAGLILAEERVMPSWVRKLHLTWFFEKIVWQQTVKKGFRARIFRKKIVQYNNQNEESKEDNGD